MQSSDIFKVYDPTPSTREIPRCTAVFSRHGQSLPCFRLEVQLQRPHRHCKRGLRQKGEPGTKHLITHTQASTICQLPQIDSLLPVFNNLLLANANKLFSSFP